MFYLPSKFSKPIKFTIKTINGKNKFNMCEGDSFYAYNEDEKDYPPFCIDMIKERELVIYINPFKFKEWNEKEKRLEINKEDKNKQ